MPLVTNAGMQGSMSRKGNPLNNAAMETYFHTIKAERMHHKLFENK